MKRIGSLLLIGLLLLGLVSCGGGKLSEEKFREVARKRDAKVEGTHEFVSETNSKLNLRTVTSMGTIFKESSSALYFNVFDSSEGADSFYKYVVTANHPYIKQGKSGRISFVVIINEKNISSTKNTIHVLDNDTILTITGPLKASVNILKEFGISVNELTASEVDSIVIMAIQETLEREARNKFNSDKVKINFDAKKQTFVLKNTSENFENLVKDIKKLNSNNYDQWYEVRDKIVHLTKFAIDQEGNHYNISLYNSDSSEALLRASEGHVLADFVDGIKKDYEAKVASELGLSVEELNVAQEIAYNHIEKTTRATRKTLLDELTSEKYSDNVIKYFIEDSNIDWKNEAYDFLVEEIAFRGRLGLTRKLTESEVEKMLSSENFNKTEIDYATQKIGDQIEID